MAAADASASGKAILYVDDTAMLVDVVSKMLVELNYEPHGFVDPHEALEAIHADEPGFALVIADRSMPHMSGLDLAKVVRERRPDLPVILVTGLHDKFLDGIYSRLGIASVLQKPFSSADLAFHVAQALEDARKLRSSCSP